MKSVAVVNLKGGVGKSALARALAVSVAREFARQAEGTRAGGPSVALIDVDRPMYGTLGWYEERKRRIDGGDSDLILPELGVSSGTAPPPDSVKLAVYDLPGRMDGEDRIDAEALLILARVDLVVIPLRADRDDAREVNRLVGVITQIQHSRRRKLPFRAVITFFDSADFECVESAATLRARGFPDGGSFTATNVRALTGWTRSSNRGRVPSEMGRTRAAEDQMSVVREVMEALNEGDRKE